MQAEAEQKRETEMLKQQTRDANKELPKKPSKGRKSIHLLHQVTKSHLIFSPMLLVRNFL